MAIYRVALRLASADERAADFAFYFGAAMPRAATVPPNVSLKTYHATDNGNGYVTIHDLELVGPMPAGHRPDAVGKSPALGVEWMREVLKTHLAQLVGGYVAPVHAGHHGDGEVPAVGSFVPLRVARMKYEGEEIEVVVGDVTVDAATLAAIRRGEYPFRSIEVERWGNHVITSLALLPPSQPPFWRFPMLKNVVVDNVPTPEVPESASLDVAALSIVVPTKRASRFLDAPARLRADAIVRLAYAKAGDEEDGEDGDEPKPKDGEGKKPFGGEGDDAEMDAESGDEGEGGNKMLASILKGIEAILKAVTGKKDRDAVQPAHDESPEDNGEETESELCGECGEMNCEGHDEDGAGEKPRRKENANMAATNTTLDADTKAKLATLTAENATLATKNAELSTQVTALSARLDKSEKDAKCAAFATAAEKRLRAKRVIVPAKFGETVAKLYAAGEDHAEAFVATLETSGRQDPPETFADEIASASSAADDPALTPYMQAGNVAKLEAARKALNECRAYNAKCPGNPITSAEWLKVHVPLATVKA